MEQSNGMSLLLHEIRELRVSMDSKLVQVQSQLVQQAASFKEELVKLRLELVSRVEFEALEVKGERERESERER